MLDKRKERGGEFPQFGTLPFHRALLLVPHIIICIVSSCSNIQGKKERGGKLAQFGTGLWARHYNL
jgi:hypothetical protein